MLGVQLFDDRRRQRDAVYSDASATRRHCEARTTSGEATQALPTCDRFICARRATRRLVPVHDGKIPSADGSLAETKKQIGLGALRPHRSARSPVSPTR